MAYLHGSIFLAVSSFALIQINDSVSWREFLIRASARNRGQFFRAHSPNLDVSQFLFRDLLFRLQ